MNARTLSAAWLREQRPPSGVIPLSAELAPVLADALEIADDGARSTVEIEFVDLLIGDMRWYDTKTADPDNAEWITQAVRYLEARGLIERRPGEEHLVRMLEVPPA
jgi:hypothetical protein